MNATAKDVAEREFDDLRPLVVDLDGTLLRSDLLHEAFWSAFARDLLAPLKAIASLRTGRAALKQRLTDEAPLDLARLPYDPEILAYIRAWRGGGGRVILVTASDRRLAEGVAAHLGLFDEVHGTDGATNLKGEVKAAFLAKRFGAGGFDYIGDAWADLPVWEQAERAITVNAGPALRATVDGRGRPVEHLQTVERSWKPYIQALRPHQWLKNLLVFLPMLAAHRFDAGTLALSLAAFMVFSLIASSAYLLNDLLDLQADREHPRKSRRPVASGRLPIAHAGMMAVAGAGLGMMLALGIGGLFALVMAAYYGLTVAYSLVFKRRLIIDICVLAGLYTLRIIAGAAATGIHLTVWLLAFSLFLFLSLAAVKRQAELVDMSRRGLLTTMGRGYHINDLPIISTIAIAAGFLSVLVLALYINSPGVVELYAQPSLFWGVCCILLYWVSRMVMTAHRGCMHDDPIIFALKDRVSRISILLCAVLAAAAALL